ncbi:MAG: GNAT family N-acetyltransferase [Desulfovibrio sp.]|jgi:ribosomal protein S18 acetylase RimI-like enzyme|nr:GNAT family N-acetyltransferase [Desulfovibrio sp.]
MNLRLQFNTQGLDWAEAARVFSATLAPRAPDLLQRAFEASSVTAFAFDGRRVVGMGRALDDGVFQAAIYDLCLLPEYQGQGQGAALLSGLLERIHGRTVLLYAVPGKEGFYERFGFRVMQTAMGRFENPARMERLGYLRSTL